MMSTTAFTLPLPLFSCSRDSDDDDDDVGDDDDDDDASRFVRMENGDGSEGGDTDRILRCDADDDDDDDGDWILLLLFGIHQW